MALGRISKKAFDNLKSSLAKHPVIEFFYPNLQVTILTDASKNGRLQDKEPVAYAPRALTENEQKFAQIEKVTICNCLQS